MADETIASAKLAAWLDAKNVTQRELARVFGVSPATATYWCSGESRPSHARALALEAWTDGAVPASSWLDAEERSEFDRLAQLGPFQR